VDLLDLLVIKVAFAPPELPSPVASQSLRSLLAAKAESDRRNYAAKHAILRNMILQEPSNFEIDSEDGGIVGLTHRNGFRIHIPRTALPTVKLVRRPPTLLKEAAAAKTRQSTLLRRNNAWNTVRGL